MRALLDEHLYPQIAADLQQGGLDVLAVADREDLVGRGDRFILDVASREGRAVVTNIIKDFRPLAAELLARGRTHGGLVLLPSARTRSRAAVPALVSVLGELMRAHPDGIASSERWIGSLPEP